MDTKGPRRMTAMEALHKLTWDESYKGMSVEVGYYDRVSDGLKYIALVDMDISDKMHFVITVDGRDSRVPYHRLREMRLDGEMVWSRETGWVGG